MQTITVEVIEEKAMKLLKGVEQLQLIRLRQENGPKGSRVDFVKKYKGAMTKQPLSEVDKQLDELRNARE